MRKIVAIAKKETLEVVRDPITLGIAIVLPVVMMFLFAYAITLDVKDVSIAVLDLDQSSASREYLASFLQSGYFRLAATPRRSKDIGGLLDKGEVRMAVVIPPDFSTRLAEGRPAPVQTLIDGAFSNTAIVILNYLAVIDQKANARIGSLYLSRRLGSVRTDVAIRAESRVRFNPSLRSVSYIIPGLFAVILMAFPPMLAALAVVREHERGSIQQVFTSPVRAVDFIIGKMVPYAGIASLEMLLLLGAGTLWFRVPVHGSTVLLLLFSLLYVVCTVGIGLLVSSLTRSQVVAVLLALVLTLMPSFLFSGFLFPISSMPGAFQMYTYLFPARYFNDITRGIVLKGVGLETLWTQGVALLLYSMAVLAIASLRFRKKVA